MLSYKQWKSLNESILPSFNLGVSGPQNIGLHLQNGFDLEEARHAKKKKPDVEVEVKDEDEDEDEEEKEDGKSNKNKKCGMKCGKSCSKCGKMSKKEMLSDDDDYEDEEDEGDEDEDDEEEDEGDEDEGDEEEEEGDDDEGDEEEDDKPTMKMSKKKMLKGDQHEIDANKDGKITGTDFKILRNRKKKKNEQAELNSWWNSVNNMLGPNPDAKFNDGWSEYHSDNLFRPIDQDNLTQAVREEPGPGEVGYAPSARMGGALGGNTFEEGMITSKRAGAKSKKSGDGESRHPRWNLPDEVAASEESEKELEKDKDLEKEYEGEQGKGVRFHIKRKSKKK